MAKRFVSTEELLRRVKEARLAEERVREPYIVAFRATREEIEMRNGEDADEISLSEEAFRHLAERIARSGRGGVRFERYLVRQGFYTSIPTDDALSKT